MRLSVAIWAQSATADRSVGKSKTSCMRCMKDHIFYILNISANVTLFRSQTSRRRDTLFSSHDGRRVTERWVEMAQYL
jgi:hypothetical protein